MESRPVCGVSHSLSAGPLLEPRPDADRVDADAKQICWNESELRRLNSDDAHDQAVDA